MPAGEQRKIVGSVVTQKMQTGQRAGSTFRREKLILAFEDQLTVENFLLAVPVSHFPFLFLHSQLSHLTS